MKRPREKQLRKLLYFMEERRRIFLNRQAGKPWPWTLDPILQRYKYCNTYREDDRVTKWIRENWREPYKDHPNLFFAMCVARMINWPDTLQEIGFPETWSAARINTLLSVRMQRGDKVFTSAYLLGGGCPKGMAKTEYIVKDVLDPVWKRIVKKDLKDPWVGWTLKAIFDRLLAMRGWGKFLAYEVVTDLRHTCYLCNAPDIQTWANIGPGAQRGLNRLYERELNQSHPQPQLLEELLEVMAWSKEERDPKLLPALEPRDLEHSLCELDKYIRVSDRIKQNRMIGLEIFKRPGIV